MINLLRALDLWRVVREVVIDIKCEGERSTLVHAFVGLDDQVEVEDIVRVREYGLHGRTKGQLLEV